MEEEAVDDVLNSLTDKDRNTLQALDIDDNEYVTDDDFKDPDLEPIPKNSSTDIDVNLDKSKEINLNDIFDDEDDLSLNIEEFDFGLGVTSNIVTDSKGAVDNIASAKDKLLKETKENIETSKIEDIKINEVIKEGKINETMHSSVEKEIDKSVIGNLILDKAIVDEDSNTKEPSTLKDNQTKNKLNIDKSEKVSSNSRKIYKKEIKDEKQDKAKVAVKNKVNNKAKASKLKPVKNKDKGEISMPENPLIKSLAKKLVVEAKDNEITATDIDYEDIEFIWDKIMDAINDVM